MLPFTRVRIVGPSMEPSLRNGEWWLARRTSRVSAGDVALIVHPHRPDLRIVKRVVRPDGSGWWVEGDRPERSEDSRQFGVVPGANVIGRLTLRYFPIRRR